MNQLSVPPIRLLRLLVVAFGVSVAGCAGGKTQLSPPTVVLTPDLGPPPAESTSDVPQSEPNPIRLAAARGSAVKTTTSQGMTVVTVEDVPIDPVQIDVQPPPPGLTLDHLLELAVSHHPAIQEADAKVMALRGKWIQVGLKPNPVATYSLDEAGVDDSSGLHRFAIGQTHVTAGKLGLQRQVVAAEIEQALADAATARQRVESDLQAVFQLALVAQERLDLTDQLRQIAEQSLQSVNAMYSAQEASRIALLQAQTELQRSELAVEVAAARLEGARGQLAAVVAVGPLPPQRLDGKISSQFQPLAVENIGQEMLMSSPEIASRAAEIERAQRSLRLACASITPNINAQVAVGIDTATDDTYGALQVSVPLPITNRNQGNIRRYRAEIRQADQALQRTEVNLSRRLALVVQTYEVARQRQHRLREEIVPRSEETLSLSIQAFEAGESNFLELLTVQRTLFQARLSLLEATGMALQASNRIDHYLIQGDVAVE